MEVNSHTKKEKRTFRNLILFIDNQNESKVKDDANFN